MNLRVMMGICINSARIIPCNDDIMPRSVHVNIPQYITHILCIFFVKDAKFSFKIFYACHAVQNMHVGDDDPAVLYLAMDAVGSCCGGVTSFESVFSLHGDARARYC